MSSTVESTPSGMDESPSIAIQGAPTPASAKSRSPSTSPPASPAPSMGALISPQGVRHFSGASASRPSPVVPSPSLPASPSFSRPTSPSGLHPRNREPTSPSPNRSTHDLSMAASPSIPDLNHIFERDVEFASSHHLSPTEAVDVAIPPVLDEAAVALSHSEELTSSEVASLVRESEDIGSGWSSPVVPPASAQHHHQHTASRSPVRGSSRQRSFSPESTGSGRATSPGSTASFSVGTPSSSPPASHPFTQHLQDALLESTTPRKPPHSIPARLSSPGPGVPFPLSAVDGSPLQQAVSADSLVDRRRLSFMSLADVINEERLNDLQGNPVGGTPTGNRTVSGGALDLDELVASLPAASGTPSV